MSKHLFSLCVHKMPTVIFGVPGGTFFALHFAHDFNFFFLSRTPALPLNFQSSRTLFHTFCFLLLVICCTCSSIRLASKSGQSEKVKRPHICFRARAGMNNSHISLNPRIIQKLFAKTSSKPSKTLEFPLGDTLVQPATLSFS